MGVCASSETVNPDRIDLSHFEIMKVVGKGGFGKVNAVTKKDTQELMALKRMEKFAVLASSAHLNMVWVERKIMSLQNSPFLCNLLYAFQSPLELYLVMPFMQGGDMRYHLREHGPLSEEHVRFYAAELLLAVADLHAKHVIFRDLKPENILLDDQGHLRLSDFGLGHQLDEERGWQITGQAGTRGYQAPEVLKNSYYGCEIDVFSYGITLYELLHGHRPWKDLQREDGGEGLDIDRMKSYQVSNKLSKQCISFLAGVLSFDWQKRLGCAPKELAEDGTFLPADQYVDWEQMKAHPFFAGYDWKQVYAKKIQPPFTPDSTRANCSPEADLADQLLDHKPRDITVVQQENFIGWDFNTSVEKKADAKPVLLQEQNQPTQLASRRGSVSGALAPPRRGSVSGAVVSAANSGVGSNGSNGANGSHKEERRRGSVSIALPDIKLESKEKTPEKSVDHTQSQQ